MRRGLSVAAAALLGAHASADVVLQRGDRPAIEGRIVRFDDNGITVARDVSGETEIESNHVFVRWDFVRDVSKDNLEDSLRAYVAKAQMLWRARTRLERGDIAQAEPLFQQLTELYRGQTHQMAMLAAEGLLRCRLAQAANEAAIIPALEMARLHQALQNREPMFSDAPPILDERTLLCPLLPPVWVNSAGLVALERELANYRADDATIRTLAKLYHRAAQRQLGIRIDADERLPAAEHPGAILLRNLVEALSTTEAERQAARQALVHDLNAAPEWAQAWSYYFLGVSQALEPDAAVRDRGLVHLTHVPARFAASQAYLAGVALAKLAEACDAAAELGGATAAASIRTELAHRFPQHPVLTGSKRVTPRVSDRVSQSVKESL